MVRTKEGAKNDPPTILVPVLSGFFLRYFFQTDVASELLKRGAKIIALVPESDERAEQTYELPKKVIVEKYRWKDCIKAKRSRRTASFLSRTRRFVLDGSRHPIRTVHGVWEIYKQRQPHPSSRDLIERLILWIVIGFLRRSQLMRRLWLKAETALCSPDIHGEVFEKYQPDLVVVSSLGIFGHDDLFIREAKRRNISTCCLMLSWDNPTTVGMRGAEPDRTLVWNKIMADELITLNDIPESTIEIVGVPHYDLYHREETFLDQKTLESKYGIKKRFVLFLTKSPKAYPWNSEVAQQIRKVLDKNNQTKDIELVVRVHPLFYSYENGKPVYHEFLEEFAQINQIDGITVNFPEIQSTSLNYSMGNEDIQVLASLIRNAEAVVNIYSTVNLEAALFDRPTVNISYEGTSWEKTDPRQAIFWDCDADHNQPVLESGAVADVSNPEALEKALLEELQNPKKRASARKHLSYNHLGANAGRAGKAIARSIWIQATSNAESFDETHSDNNIPRVENQASIPSIDLQ